jgi:serine/threonine protein kinase
VDEEGNATLIDFGMAARAPAGAVGGAEGDGVRVLMAAGPRRGKRQYMAPEVYMERDHDPFVSGGCLGVSVSGW